MIFVQDAFSFRNLTKHSFFKVLIAFYLMFLYNDTGGKRFLTPLIPDCYVLCTPAIFIFFCFVKGLPIMTTIQDIADQMGISKSTVSKALNDAPDISEALRKQVLETAVALGYTKLRRYKKSTKKVCIIIEKENMRYQEPHHFAYDILVGFRQMAEPAGFDVEIVPVDIKAQRNQHYDVFMLEHDYIGAFVVGFSLSDPWIQDFKVSRTPAVLFDNYMVGNPSTAYVGIDNEEGMELAVSYLAGLGHRKIAYLSSSLGARVLQARHAAFLRSMHQHGLKTSPATIGCSYYLSECMEKHLPRFLENGITAIICNQDTLASATLTQCQQLGFQIPDDISIIGFDDLPIAACTSPPLTTIRQDRLELGKSGFFALSSLLNHIPISTYLLHAQLIQRESTGKIPL